MIDRSWVFSFLHINRNLERVCANVWHAWLFFNPLIHRSSNVPALDVWESCLSWTLRDVHLKPESHPKRCARFL